MPQNGGGVGEAGTQPQWDAPSAAVLDERRRKDKGGQKLIKKFLNGIKLNGKLLSEMPKK